jgi:hypothetical protein
VLVLSGGRQVPDFDEVIQRLGQQPAQDLGMIYQRQALASADESPWAFGGVQHPRRDITTRPEGSMFQVRADSAQA